MPASNQGVTVAANPVTPAPLRFALIGAGGMGGVHAATLGGFPDTRLTWVVDLDLPRAEAIAAAQGARVTDSMEEACAAGDVDAVVIALPTSLHRAATEVAASHGKHVFCEKPIARTVADARAMIAACERGGVRLMVGHVVRFFQEFARAREIIAAGTLGEIAMARFSRLNAPVMGRKAWFADLEKNGGLVIDLMIHDLDTLRWYFGEVERVYAHGLSYTPYQPVRDYTLAALRFANGVTAHVEASWAHSGFRTSFEIAGQYGIVRYSSAEAASLTLERTGDAAGLAIVQQRPLAVSPYQLEMRHFVEAIRSDGPILTDGVEALKALELGLAVLESIRTGQVIRPLAAANELATAVS